MPSFLKDTIDSILNDTINNYYILGFRISIDIETPIKAAFLIGLTYIGLNILKGIFLFFMRQTIIKVSRFIEYDLKNEIYEQYQKLDYNFYKKNSTGDLMNRISEDVSQVRMYLGPSIMYTLNLIALSTLAIFAMVEINWLLTIIVLLPLPLMSLLIYKVSSKMNALSKNVQEKQSRLSTIAQETFSGIRVIKAYGREREQNQDFFDNAEEYKNRSMKLVLVNSLFMPTITLLIGLSTILAIYVGGLMSYDKAITLGGITAFIFYVNNLTWPFASIGWVTSLIQRAAASQTRINEFLKQEPSIHSGPIKLEEFRGHIIFENVSYTYPNSGIEAIHNLSFEILPGETLGIIGRTGSGKSTILKLLMRQIDPTSGDIYIDGYNLKDIDLNSLRSQTGIVPQEVFLFSDTIANNIYFGTDHKPTLEEAIHYAKMAHVHHNIDAFKDKYDTLLGERGVNLSGGQKQRISIARALIHQPKFLLLDDCLSAVDTETEEKILNNLKYESSRKTTVIVSHRISSLRNAQHILVLNEQTKAEYGSHEELLQLNGLYADLYQKQLAEENT